MPQQTSFTNTKNFRSFLSRESLIGLTIMAVVVGGLLADSLQSKNDNFFKDLLRLDNVTTKIHQKYVEKIESRKLVDHAIEGMLEILDPHTSYFQRKDYEELRIHTQGKFGGLGIQISIRDKVLTVMTPISGTPASRAGIQSGDQIIRIEGVSTKGIELDQAVAKLRGEPGSEVTISIRRKGQSNDLDYTITREIIRIKAVPFAGLFQDTIGYIRLNTFSQESDGELKKVIKTLLKNGMKACILDLRYNPGGLLDKSIEVVDIFLPRGSLVVSTRGRALGQNREHHCSSNPILPPDIPLAVLVSYASASASEIVAGAIQDYDRGIIVGDTTFGKGSVQSIEPLDESHHLKMTTAFYYTPSGRCINKPENDIRDDEDDELFSDDETTDLEENSEESDTAATKSDTATYFTKNGRIVHGGGGIVPDTIVEQEIPELPIRALFGKDVFFKFANIEYPRLNRKGLEIGKEFEIDDSLMNDFYIFLDSLDFIYKSPSFLAFEEFKKQAGLAKDTTDSTNADTGDSAAGIPKPHWSKTEKVIIDSTVDVLQQLLIDESKEEFRRNETEIKRHLREFLLVREFGQDHEIVFRERLENDIQMKAAFALLSDSKKYARFLKPGESENKAKAVEK